MKLQRVATRKYKGKTYYKWIVTIPPDIVEELGWKDGQELSATIDDTALRLH